MLGMLQVKRMEEGGLALTFNHLSLALLVLSEENRSLGQVHELQPRAVTGFGLVGQHVVGAEGPVVHLDFVHHHMGVHCRGIGS